jgi:ketose-bisphosphate aldolase
MYDGSKLPFEENVATTRMVVRAAHAVGAAVEAELGHVGTGRTYQEFGAQGKGFTDPDDVVRFVEATGVDFLAIAIGTAHGLYDGEVNLALDLLSEIRERVEIPLVLHGGSGLSDEQFQACIARGIQKVNIFTNLAVASTQKLLENARSDDANLRSMLSQIREGFRGECERLLDVFGTSGKA